MSGKKDQAETKDEARQRAEDEATGNSDLVILTNDSGEVKKLSPEEWEDQRTILAMDGWKQIGDEDRA